MLMDAQLLSPEFRYQLPQGASLSLRLSFALSAEQQASKEHQTYLKQLYWELWFIISFARFQSQVHRETAVQRYLLSTATDPAMAQRPPIEAVSCNKQVFYRRDLEPLTVEQQRFGQVFVVYEDAAAGLYRLVIAPGKSIAPHIHQQLDEYELVLTDGLKVQGQAVKRGIYHHWPRNFPHSYENSSTEAQVVLCIDHPPFQPDDEREIAQTGDLPQLAGKRRRRLW
jgi:mannose-6-phosphate isomerase-like protein (cupin superfamily)